MILPDQSTSLVGQLLVLHRLALGILNQAKTEKYNALLMLIVHTIVYSLNIAFLSGGEIKTSWAHIEREEDSAGNQLPLSGQLRVCFQSKFLFNIFLCAF